MRAGPRRARPGGQGRGHRRCIFLDDPVSWPSLALTTSEDTGAAPKPRPRYDGARASGPCVLSPARWAPLHPQSLPAATMEPVWEALDDHPAFLRDCHFSHWAGQAAPRVPVSDHRETGACRTLTMPGPGPGPLCALPGPWPRLHCPLSHVRRQKAPLCRPAQCHKMRPRGCSEWMAQEGTALISFPRRPSPPDAERG